MRTFLFSASALLFAFTLFAGSASAQALECDGTADMFGYTCLDSDDAGGPTFDFVDISGTGTALGLGDDQLSGFQPLGFSFPFYNMQDQTQIRVSSNGWLTFNPTQTSSELTNDPIPSTSTPNGGVVAVYWDDLDPSCAAPDPCEVYVQDMGDGRFIVQYDSIPHFPDTALEYNTFQAILQADGDILMQYLLFTDDASGPNSYTVGIEDSLGTDGVQAAFNEPYLRSNFAVCFDYPGSDAGCVEDTGGDCDLSFNSAILTPTTVAPGGRVTFNVDVANASGMPQDARVTLDYDRNGGNPMGTRVLIPSVQIPPQGGAGPIRVRIPGNAPAGDYNLTLNLIDNATGEVCDTATFVLTITSAGRLSNEGGELFELDAPFTLDAAATTTGQTATVAPNPFSGQTRIVYTVDATSDVRLAVYDVLGREIAVLVDANVQAGQHAATFDARGLAAGTYVYRLTVGSDVQTGRLTLTH